MPERNLYRSGASDTLAACAAKAEKIAAISINTLTMTCCSIVCHAAD